MAFDYASLEFGDFAQQLAGQTVEAATAAQFSQPYQLQQMQLQKLGTTGPVQYTEGNAAATGINKNYVLLGVAAVLLVFLLK